MDKWYVITYNHTEYTEVIGLTKTREQAEAFVKESVEKMLYDNRQYYDSGLGFEFAKSQFTACHKITEKEPWNAN